MESQDKDNTDFIKKASKVTPEKNKKAFYMQMPLLVVGLVCFILIFFMFMPSKKVRAKSESEKKASANDYTLSENLALIEKLRKTKESTKNTNAPINNEAQFRQRLNSPPKLKEKVDNKQLLSKEIRLRMNAASSFEIASISNEQAQKINPRLETDEKGLLKGGGVNANFLNAQSSITAVSATKLPHPDLTIPAGEMIPATLEVAVDSDLAGMLRAITTRDIYSLQGANVLIPRGSTLVGQFNSAVMQGQSRIFIVWNRVQMNDGVIVTLNSPSSDQIGRAGLGADIVNTHFWQRFGNSSLLSILGATTALAGVSDQDRFNSASQFRSAISSSFQQSAKKSLEKMGAIKNTLIKFQGAKINVFVAHDLDFSNVGKRHEPRYKIARRPGVWK